jgi:hypothetical protein
MDVEVAVELDGVRGAFRAAPAGRSTEIALDGLAADTAYAWRLWLRHGAREEQGPVRALRTQRAPGAPFTFAVTGDGHFLNMEHRRAFSSMHLLAATYETIAGDHPDFLLDLGDSFNSESYRSFDAPDDEEALRRHLGVRPYFERAETAFFAVIGNHEGGSPDFETGQIERATRCFPIRPQTGSIRETTRIRKRATITPSRGGMRWWW